MTVHSDIVVVHGGVSYEVDPAGSLTFGRSATCDIRLAPDDVGISRLAGSVEHEGGTWWLYNRSSVRPLTAVDDIGIRTVIPPGRRVAVVGPMTVIVEGAIRRHAIDIRVENPAPVASELHDRSAHVQTTDTEGILPTSSGQEVVVSDMDRLALVALFSGYLEPFPRYDPHPKSYADAAAALGWPRTTLVKRIEYLRTRLTNAGVPNMVGETALPHLAEWVLTTGVLVRSDLELLHQDQTARPHRDP